MLSSITLPGDSEEEERFRSLLLAPMFAPISRHAYHKQISGLEAISILYTLTGMLRVDAGFQDA